MRLVTAEPARRTLALHLTIAPRERHRGHVEGIALAVTTIVIALGLWLAYRQQLSEVQSSSAGGALVDLNRASGSAIAPALTVFPAASEREFAARAIVARVGGTGPLTHVGALTSVTVAAADVRKDPRLATLNARLGGSSNAAIGVFNASDVAALKPNLAVRSLDEYRRGIGYIALVFVAAFWLVHLVRRVAGRTGDPLLLPAMQLLSGLGLMAMIALRDPLRDTDAALGFAYGVAFGCLALVGLSFVNFENPRFRRATVVPFFAAVGLAVALVLFGSGPGESGVKVNLLGVQPIEAIRLLAVLALASYFSRRWELLREFSSTHGPTHMVRRFVKLPRGRDVQPLAVMLGVLFLFFFAQRDLGPALVLGCMSLALYGVARGRAGLVLGGMLVLVAGFTVAYWTGVPGTLARRVAIWLDPWGNARSGGDQIAHALWALSSGGIGGMGAGAGDGYLVPAGQTDLILSVVGEELGLAGVVAIGVVYALLIWRMLRIAARAPGDYTAFLALGCALSLAVPAIIIVGGELGALPLSGVATPFLTFGKSSMIANFCAAGIALAIGTRLQAAPRSLARQLRPVGWTLGALAVLLVGRATWIQAAAADDIALRPTVVRDADGEVRYRYNPRLLAAARLMPRGSIVDRNGLALATGEPAQADATIGRLRKLRVDRLADCLPGSRCYPLGGLAFHVTGEAVHQTNWAARNASFVERDANATLQGFDDHAHAVEVRLRDGRTHTLVAHDYSELLPLMRHKGDPSHTAVRRMLDKPRDVRLTLDGPLQAAVAQALAHRAASVRAPGGGRRGRRRCNRGGARLRQLPVAGARRIGRGWSAAARRAPRPRTLRSLSAGLDVQADCRGGGPDGRRRQSHTHVRLRAPGGRPRRRTRPRRVASDPRRPDGQDAARPGRPAQGAGGLVQCVFLAAGHAPRSAGDQPCRRAAADSGLFDPREPARHAAIRRLRSRRGARQPAAHGAGRGSHRQQRQHPRSGHRATRCEDRCDERALAAPP